MCSRNTLFRDIWLYRFLPSWWYIFSEKLRLLGRHTGVRSTWNWELLHFPMIFEILQFCYCLSLKKKLLSYNVGTSGPQFNMWRSLLKFQTGFTSFAWFWGKYHLVYLLVFLIKYRTDTASASNLYRPAIGKASWQTNSTFYVWNNGHQTCLLVHIIVITRNN